jgi:hypothetical protein
MLTLQLDDTTIDLDHCTETELSEEDRQILEITKDLATEYPDRHWKQKELVAEIQQAIVAHELAALVNAGYIKIGGVSKDGELIYTSTGRSLEQPPKFD